MSQPTVLSTKRIEVNFTAGSPHERITGDIRPTVFRAQDGNGVSSEMSANDLLAWITWHVQHERIVSIKVTVAV